MNIYPADQNSFSSAIALLKQNELPTNDIDDSSRLFVMINGAEVVGTIGLEHDGQDALLRSLSVSANHRNKGIGDQLVAFIEQYSNQQGVRSIYLLTTTAREYFQRKGYAIIDRNAVSEFIKKTSEYCSVCPSSAAVMKKTLV